MAAPAGALQRAALVAVPLGLVVLIFLTPSLVGPERPQATDIPFFLAQVTGQAWNESVNETALLYVRSALGFPIYGYIAINVTGLGPVELAVDCGGNVTGGGGTWSCSETTVPSLWFKFPANDTMSVNVTAVAIQGETTFGYNATIEFAWEEAGWILRVQPEDATAPLVRREMFSTSMRPEVPP